MKITYVFIGGRKENFINSTIEAFDFYYGIQMFSKKKAIIEILEFSERKSYFYKFLYKVEYYASKLLSLPINFFKLTSIKNFRTLFNSDQIILVSETTGLAALPMLFVIKLFRNPSVSLFVMGLFSKKINYSSLEFLHKLFIKILILPIDNLFFLGKGELNLAKKNKVKKTNYYFLPFCIDTKFWDSPKIQNIKKNQILFVGNDGNRDYVLLKKIAQELQHYNFIFVTSRINEEDFNLKNVQILNGNWGSDLLTDSQLRQIYAESLFTIIPLKENTQPSGQSVALQSMCSGTPVMMSSTDGFWDKDLFEHNEDIFFIYDNSHKEWVEQIERLYNDDKLINKLSLNGKKKVDDNYNLKQLKQYLTNYLSYEI